MNCKVYLEKSDINDATSYYVNIVEKSLQHEGYSISRVDSLDSIGKDDLVLVIHAKAFYRVWRKNKKQRIMIWFQGIVPEEAKMIFPNPLQYIPRMVLWRFFERKALKYAESCLFVSDAMRLHYEKKYNYKKSNYFVMPCFNLELDRDSFFVDGKYDTPRFVYAGSLAAWQCVEQTIASYSKIEKQYPDSTFTMLTGDAEKARVLIEKYGVKNFEIKYVKQSELNAELSKYKYGFLLREDTAVNNVATPTKMNSYMAAGVIPVYSQVVGDFKTVFSKSKFIVTVDEFNVNVDEVESSVIDPQKVFEEYKVIFDTYYNTEKYIDDLTKI